MLYLCAMDWNIDDIEQWGEVARYILARKKYSVLRIEGEMGAGKTTFVARLLAEMGSEDHVSSPTYALVNEYHTPIGRVYHFDLYRLKEYQELEDLGFYEYIDGGDLCVIEWADSFPKVFENRNFHTLTVRVIEGKREISFC